MITKFKVYENWFTNLFKGDDTWRDFADKKTGITKLMRYASDGDFYNLNKILPYSLPNINIIHSEYLDDNSKYQMTALTCAVSSHCNLSKKKRMIKLLIDNGADVLFEDENDDKGFFDMIKGGKLEEWFRDVYPGVMEDWEIGNESNKYNLL